MTKETEIILIVKGDIDRVKLEARRRGITLTRLLRKGNVTWAYAPGYQRKKVTEWFCEENATGPGGYGPGTCLYYREKGAIMAHPKHLDGR